MAYNSESSRFEPLADLDGGAGSPVRRQMSMRNEIIPELVLDEKTVEEQLAAIIQ